MQRGAAITKMVPAWRRHFDARKWYAPGCSPRDKGLTFFLPNGLPWGSISDIILEACLIKHVITNLSRNRYYTETHMKNKNLKQLCIIGINNHGLICEFASMELR